MAADMFNFELVRFLMENGASCCAHYMGPDITPEFPPKTNLSPEFEMLGLVNPDELESSSSPDDKEKNNEKKKTEDEIEIPPGVEPEPSKSSKRKINITRKPRRRA